jgi:DNA-directed RNA polymerase specialized sigma24 family protein
LKGLIRNPLFKVKGTKVKLPGRWDQFVSTFFIYTLPCEYLILAIMWKTHNFEYMTGAEAILNICQKKMLKVSGKVCKDDNLKEDLLSEAILVLLESKETFIEVSECERFLVHTMFRLWTQSRGGFSEKYKQFERTESIEHYDFMAEDAVEGKREYANNHLVTAALNQIRWYNRELIQMKAEGKTFRKIAKETGINHNSVYHAIMQGRKQIKEYLNIND